MSLFNTTKKKNSTLILTPVLAQEIYGAIEKYGTAQAAFLAPDTNFDFSNCKLVWTELKTLETEIMSKMSGTFIIKAGTPAVYDEKGKLVKEAIPPVYFVVKSEKMLVASLKSDLLDVAILTQHVREYSDGNPDAAPDFKTWLESFKKEM